MSHGRLPASRQRRRQNPLPHLEPEEVGRGSYVGVFSLQFPLTRGRWATQLRPPPYLSPLQGPRQGLVSTSVCRLILWHSPGILRGHRGAGGTPRPSQFAPTLCVGRSLRRAQRPPKAPPRGTYGRLEPRTAPPVQGLRESYRGELARHQNPDPSYPPRECLCPAADSPSPNGFLEPSAATTSFAASQNGRQPAQPLRVPEGAGRRNRHGAGQRTRANALGRPPGS